MAILFYEPKNTETEHAVDQVDGHVPHSTTAAATPTAAAVEASADDSNNSSPTAAAGEELPWKLLALAMCKVLKTYYQQMGNTATPQFSSAIIEILPGAPTQTE